jgi:hypothetical protein
LAFDAWPQGQKADLTAFSTFAPRQNRVIPASIEGQPIRTREFPQFFPQVWKTLGRDQTGIG